MGPTRTISAVVDEVNMGNVYARSGPSIGLRATAPYVGGVAAPGGGQTVPAASSAPSTAGDQVVAKAFMVGNQGSIVSAFLVILALLVLLMFSAKKLGGEGEFSNIKMSFYNVLVISLAAIIGIPLFKALFTYIPVPGISKYALSV